MTKVRGMNNYSIGHAIFFAFASVLIFVLARFSEGLLETTPLSSLIPEQPLANYPYLIEACILGWFIFSTYWFYAFIDEKGWWTELGVGFLFGVSAVFWAASIFASPFLVIRHLILSHKKGPKAVAKQKVASSLQSPAQRACESLMRDWQYIRPLIIQGESVLKEVFDKTAIDIKIFVAYLEMEMAFTKEQINTNFFRWFGISHLYSYDMALLNMDPSDPEDVRKYLKKQCYQDYLVDEVLALMPRMRRSLEPWEIHTETEGLAYNSEGHLEYRAPDNHMTLDPRSRKAIVDSIKPIDPETWLKV